MFTLTGQTPFEGGGDRGIATDFLIKTIVADLKKTGQAEKDLYFDKVRLMWCNAIGKSGSTGGWTSSTSHTKGSRRVHRSARGFSGRDIATIARTTEGNDPVTGESILKDWEFEIVFAAVLGERPQADPSAEQD